MTYFMSKENSPSAVVELNACCASPRFPGCFASAACLGLEANDEYP